MKDLIGQKFSRLTVLRKAERINGRQIWVCLCDCGNTTNVRQNNLLCAGVKSCGCLLVEQSSKVHKTHGRSRTREYRIWTNIISRCENPKVEAFQHYGGRGIAMCEAWRKSFTTFLQDMGECPPGFTIERKNNDANYCPENCIWATIKTQANNTRQNRLVSFNGSLKTVAQWSEHLGLPYSRLYQRLFKYGWNTERAMQ